jgi:6-phosphogluconolactonase (cycloisomerase 2 family)
MNNGRISIDPELHPKRRTMKTHTRRAVAYIAGGLASGRASTAVYDYQEKRYVNMSGNLTKSSISIYDYDQKCHIGGSGTSLYHYGNRAHIALAQDTAHFSGYDYDSRKHFSGSLSGTNIALYDYETGKHYNYSI